MKADYDNYQGFIITGLSASPTPKVALRLTGGFGFLETKTEDYMDNRITAAYNEDFIKKFNPTQLFFLEAASGHKIETGGKYSAPNVNVAVDMENTIINAQGRFDADIELGKGFIAAAGVQELYSMWKLREDINLDFIEMTIVDGDGNLKVDPDKMPPQIRGAILALRNIPNLSIIREQADFNGNVKNQGFTSSAYGLIEYKSPNRRFEAELGLRVDHLFFKGRDFSFYTMPALNPRLNVDFNLFKNRGAIDSLTITAGSGLFSSINSLLCFFDPGNFNIGDSGDLEVKFNRSWTSVIGTKIDFAEKFSLNIEGYYKYVFDRGYITAEQPVDMGEIIPSFNFDGVGNVYGFDVQLQKMESRYWDGWISYTFTWAKYRDPSRTEDDLTSDIGDIWYYPSFHRFHNFNLVLNIKPLQWFNIALRFGFASGQPMNKRDDKPPEPYPVLLINDENKVDVLQKYRRKSWYDDDERAPWSFPLDIKFSFFPVNKNGRASMEIYAAGENMMSLIYTPPARTTYNSYSGKEDKGGSSGSFDLPIPMVSFGIKWRY